MTKRETLKSALSILWDELPVILFVLAVIVLILFIVVYTVKTPYEKYTGWKKALAAIIGIPALVIGLPLDVLFNSLAGPFLFSKRQYTHPKYYLSTFTGTLKRVQEDLRVTLSQLSTAKVICEALNLFDKDGHC